MLLPEHLIYVGMELLIRIHHVYLQYAAGRDSLTPSSASRYSFLLGKNCLSSAD